MIENLNQETAAAIAGLTPRRLRQIEAEGGAPARDAEGHYPAAEFGRWLLKRADPGDDKARLIKAKRELAEMTLAEKRGRLVEKETIIKQYLLLVVACKTRLRLIPATVARLVVGKEVAEARRILLEYIDQALLELSTAETRPVKPGNGVDATEV